MVELSREHGLDEDCSIAQDDSPSFHSVSYRRGYLFHGQDLQDGEGHARYRLCLAHIDVA